MGLGVVALETVLGGCALSVIYLIAFGVSYIRCLKQSSLPLFLRLVGRTGCMRTFYFLVTLRKVLSSPLANTAEGSDARGALRRVSRLTLDPSKPTVMFVGSSTFTYWRLLEADFASLNANIVNGAFGGSTTSQVTHWMDKVVLPFNPAVVVYYCGANDLTLGQTASLQVAQGFIDFVDRLPCDVGVVYLGVSKTLLQRWWGEAMITLIDQVNQHVGDYIAQSMTRRMEFVDTDDADFLNKEEFYLCDNHHLNDAGHRQLANLLRPVVSTLLHK